MKRALATVALVVLAVGLPLRAELQQYSKEVPRSPETYVAPRTAVSFAHIRWELVAYSRPEKLKLDPFDHGVLLLRLEPPKRSGEVWVMAELRAEAIDDTGQKNAGAMRFMLRDRSGHEWNAGIYSGDVQSGQVRVVGVVPATVADEVQLTVKKGASLWIGRPPPEELGGPLLVFRR